MTSGETRGESGGSNPARPYQIGRHPLLKRGTDIKPLVWLPSDPGIGALFHFGVGQGTNWSPTGGIHSGVMTSGDGRNAARCLSEIEITGCCWRGAVAGRNPQGIDPGLNSRCERHRPPRSLPQTKGKRALLVVLWRFRADTPNRFHDGVPDLGMATRGYM